MYSRSRWRSKELTEPLPKVPLSPPNCIFTTSNSLSIGQLSINCRSIRNKAADLELYVLSCAQPIACICLTETWLLESDSDAVFTSSIRDLFHVYRCDRNVGEAVRGGGVAILVSKSLKSSIASLNTSQESVLHATLPKPITSKSMIF
jgi:hypothetical protein